MTRWHGRWQHSRETPVAAPSGIVIRRDRAEASPSAGHSLTRTGSRQDENMKSSIAREGRDLVRHRAEIEGIDVIGAADHVVEAKFHHDLRRRLARRLFL